VMEFTRVVVGGEGGAVGNDVGKAYVPIRVRIGGLWHGGCGLHMRKNGDELSWECISANGKKQNSPPFDHLACEGGRFSRSWVLAAIPLLAGVPHLILPRRRNPSSSKPLPRTSKCSDPHPECFFKKALQIPKGPSGSDFPRHG